MRNAYEGDRGAMLGSASGCSLRDLARAAGIDANYSSWRGEPTAASDEAVIAALSAIAPDLGIDFDARMPGAA